MPQHRLAPLRTRGIPEGWRTGAQDNERVRELPQGDAGSDDYIRRSGGTGRSMAS